MENLQDKPRFLIVVRASQKFSRRLGCGVHRGQQLFGTTLSVGCGRALPVLWGGWAPSTGCHLASSVHWVLAWSKGRIGCFLFIEKSNTIYIHIYIYIYILSSYVVLLIKFYICVVHLKYGKNDNNTVKSYFI